MIALKKEWAKLLERLRTFFRYKDLLIQMVTRDIKLKYRRSYITNKN